MPVSRVISLRLAYLAVIAALAGVAACGSGSDAASTTSSITVISTTTTEPVVSTTVSPLEQLEILGPVAWDLTRGSGSARVAGSFSVFIDGVSIAWDFHGEYDFSGRRMAIGLTILGAGPAEMRMVDDIVYVGMSILPEGVDWVRFAPDDTDDAERLGLGMAGMAAMLDPFGPDPYDISALLADAVDVQRLDVDRDRFGESARHWRIELGPGGVRGLAQRFDPGAPVPSGLEALVDLWIDDDGRLVGVRYEFVGDAADVGFSSFTLEHEYYDLGAPVEIAAPEPDSVIDLAELASLEEGLDDAPRDELDEPGFHASVRVRGGDDAVLEAARSIFEQRLVDALGPATAGRIWTQGSMLLIWLPPESDPEVMDYIVAPGVISMRHVLAVDVVSPHLGADEVPPGIDPSTGLTHTDNLHEAAYLAGADGLVYHVGPARLVNAHFSGAEAGFTAGLGDGGYVVDPEFTVEGGRAFVELTQELSRYPVGDQRRQLAIVVDGRVISAPQIAAEVAPGQGLDPEQVVITIGASDDAEREALQLAAYIRNGALPESLEITTWYLP